MYTGPAGKGGDNGFPTEEQPKLGRCCTEPDSRGEVSGGLSCRVLVGKVGHDEVRSHTASSKCPCGVSFSIFEHDSNEGWTVF